MINIGLPIFSLKSTEDYLFIAGGGGSKEYGKENGVMAIRKTALLNKAEKMEHFFKTSDLIIHIQIYTEKTELKANLLPNISLAEAPSMADGFEEEDSKLIHPLIGDVSSSEESNVIERRPELEKIERKPVDKKPVERKPVNAVFILAIGDDNVYILKFTNSFTLHCKLSKRIDKAILNKHLFLLTNNKLQGYFDIIKSPSAVNFDFKVVKDNISDPTEEYIYKLYKRGGEVIPLNENFTRDIPKDWNNFFIYQNKAHKIIKEDNMNIFVFRKQKYEIPERMSNVTVYGETIVFYSNTSENGNLYFIGEDDKVYKLALITSMNVWENSVVVVTQQGNAIVYQDGKYVQRIGSFTTPVTGLALDNSYLYYTLLDGQLGYFRRVSNLEKSFKIASLVVLILAIVIYLMFRLKVRK